MGDHGDLINNIGFGFYDSEDYLDMEFQKDLEEILAQHRLECKDPFGLEGRCDCPHIPSSVRHPGSPSRQQQLSRMSPARHFVQEQARPMSPARTYAQVARPRGMSHEPSHPNAAAHVPVYQPSALSQAPGFQTIEEWMDTSTYVASPAPRSTTERSYAAVASQAAEEAKLRARSRQQAPPQANEYAQLNVARRTPAQNAMHYVPPNQATTQYNRREYTGRGPVNQQRMLPPQSSTPRMPFHNRLPQVMEDVTYALRPERTPDPRNVNTLVQRTQRGSQRQALAPSPAPYPSTPTSPGTISEASFASTRRTGDARYDPSLPFSCNTCHQTFRTNEDLKRHGRNVHQERQYVCEVDGCNQAFVFPKDRKRHYESAAHAGVRVPKACPYCPKTYTRKDNLERHIRNDHGSDSGIGASMSRSTSFSGGGYSMSRSTSSASNNFAFSPPA